MRVVGLPESLAAFNDAYTRWQESRGADLTIGSRLGPMAEEAGLVVEACEFGGAVIRLPTGVRPPAWAAREAMLADGVVTAEQLAGWERDLAELDTRPVRPWLAPPDWRVLARRPG